jgi:hypothetical protein
MTNPLDNIGNPFLQEVENPFTLGSSNYVKRDPLTARSMDEATDILRDNALSGIMNAPQPVKNALGVAGKVLQPFMGVQQLLFTGIRSTQDAFDGEDETDAWETMKRGGRSALSFLTWGGYQAAGLKQGDPRAKYITGYELFKDSGAPNWVARWGGTAADFFLDVPLLGAAGKAAKLDRLTAGLRIGENMAQTFDSPGALRAFVGGVAAAPFTTQPIKRVVEAIPQGLRQQGRERLIDPILNARTVPGNEFDPVRPTLGQTLIARHMGVPDPVAAALERKTAVSSQYAVLHNEALAAFDQAKKGLDFQSGKKLDDLVGKLADASSPADRVMLEGQIRALEATTGRAGLFDDAIRATNKGIQFDTFSAEKLNAAGLMSEDALKAYQSGDKRHLRRVYAMYGEDAPSHLRRIMDRDNPASVTFDDAGLERLYGATLNPTMPPAPPLGSFGKSAVARNPVGEFPSRTPLLDPVADSERLVWRDVPREIEVGTVDRGSLDLGGLGKSELTSLRNLLGWDAIKQVDGRWRVLGGVTDSFPVGHPLIQNLFGDLKEQGLAGALRVEERNFREQVPNFYDPKSRAPLDVQRAYADEELAGMEGALYVHNRDLTAFMAGATDQEAAALERALERYPTREQTRTVGKNQVEDMWLPVDPADPDMARLIERAKGGATALFDGATGQPALASVVLPTKSRPSLPSSADFKKAVQAAYTNTDQHPADFLKGFFSERGMDEGHVLRVLEGIGQDYAQKAGIAYRPADAEIVRYFTRKRAAEAAGPAGDMAGRGTKAVTTQRQEVSEWYADALGEVSSFTERLGQQARVTSRAATLNGTLKEIRQYLTDNDLIETVGTADMGAVHKTAGLRVLSGEQARSLGNGFREGEVIPAEIHRILLEQVSTRQAAPLGLAWQWYSSRWQGVKLANPGSILTNLRSAFVQADHAGQSIPGLLGGIRDYLALHRQAVRGDGAMDVNAKVNGVTMRELFDHGAFTHNTLMNSEVVQQSSRLMDELANPAGNPLQRGVAAMQEWLTGTAQGARAAQVYGKAVAPVRWLGDTYGRVDSMMKGGLYMSLRKQGMDAQQAAKLADETFFNYENVPYVVDGLRRFGLAGMPFASFKLLATGRFFRSLYQNPYGVERYYRLGNSSRAAMADQQEEGGENSLTAYDKGSPDYIRQGLYIPMGKDSEGRVRAVRLGDILPETAIFDSFNADGVAGTIPPALQLVGQLNSGKGYQGRDVYRTGGTYAETVRLNPQEAARGVVAQLWQFGAYPWAPGQPMTERIVKAIADKAVPVESISNPLAQRTLKLLTQGPAGAFDPAPFSTEKKGTQPVPDVGDALARIFGVKAYPVSTSASVPGSYQSNLIGRDMDIQTLNKMEAGEMRTAQTPEQRADIRRRYDELRAPIIRKQRGQ